MTPQSTVRWDCTRSAKLDARAPRNATLSMTVLRSLAMNDSPATTKRDRHARIVDPRQRSLNSPAGNRAALLASLESHADFRKLRLHAVGAGERPLGLPVPVLR